VTTLDAAYDDEFFRLLADQSEAHGMNPRDFLALVAGECDFVWRARNQYGYAGMTQMGAAALRAAGWTAAMGPFEAARPAIQLPYSWRYFDAHRKRTPKGRWESAGMLWLANLAPAHLGRTDGVVYARAQHPKQYDANAGLDVDRDGVITVSDLDDKFARLLAGQVPGRRNTAALYAQATERLAQWTVQPPRERSGELLAAVPITELARPQRPIG